MRTLEKEKNQAELELLHSAQSNGNQTNRIKEIQDQLDEATNEV